MMLPIWLYKTIFNADNLSLDLFSYEEINNLRQLLIISQRHDETSQRSMD